jgi:uncharacterized protein HemY
VKVDPLVEACTAAVEAVRDAKAAVKDHRKIAKAESVLADAFAKMEEGHYRLALQWFRKAQKIAERILDGRK